MTTDRVAAFIQHHGVKGMKWGVRRANPSQTAPSMQKPHPSTLSNHELQAAVNRMRLEQQYSDLVRQTTPKSKGKAFAESILSKGGNMVLNQTLVTLSSRLVKKALGN